MIIEDLIYTSKISLTQKAYNLQLPNAKRVIIRLEVNEKPYNYKRHIMPFELVAFHCEECGEKYIASFLEYVAHDLSKEAKKFYTPKMIYILLYCKTNSIINNISKYIPLSATQVMN